MDQAPGRMEECLENEPPFCAVACPFHLDVRDFLAKMRRGGFQAAHRAYLNAVGFPGIVAALCDEPCRAVCPRGECGGALSLRLLERVALTLARNLEPHRYNLPPKPHRVAVVGAGISGLACALRMAEKGYPVTVYERAPHWGGHVRTLMPLDALQEELARQFRHVEWDLRLGREIKALEEVEADAVYVATGAGGAAFGLEPEAAGAFATRTPGVFFGGSLRGRDTLGALADGLRAVQALERHLKTGGLHPSGEEMTTHLEVDVSRTPPLEPVVPAEGAGYTREEAMGEAARCLDCSCDACMKHCDLMEYFRKFPRRIADEVHLTLHPGTLDGAGTVATRLISTCNQCGLCRVVCPKGIDTGDLLLQAHRVQRARGAMPWAFHELYLRDMAFTNGEAALTRKPAGAGTCRRIFFPGCQLGASDPSYVTGSYRFLLEHGPDTALALRCCGAPAEWAGDEALRDGTLAGFREDWEALGRPEVVYACPSCKQMLERHLPGVRGVFLYELMAEKGLVPPGAGRGGRASVFDPCASREEPGVQRAVRTLAEGAGFHLEALPREGGLAPCCGSGGQVALAHPPYARHVALARAGEGGEPYITYCSNCRDTFAGVGKLAWHILDLLLGLSGPDRPRPTLSERRRNRIDLKRRMLASFWGETDTMEPTSTGLAFPAELRRKLADAMILEEDILRVVEHCKATGLKVLDPEAGTFAGHLVVGCMTFWAVYRTLPGGGLEVVNAYGHRMSLEEG